MLHEGPYSISNRKIDPARRRPAKPLKPDGTPDDKDRVEIGPTDIAFSEWAALGLEAPNLDIMRQARLDRLTAELQRRDYGAALLFDPLNIRYATDSSNMHIWIMHNPARAAFVAADGHMVLWDFHGCDHLSSYLPLIKEVRHGADIFYFTAGDSGARKAEKLASDVADLMREHCGDNRRIAVDRWELEGCDALRHAGLDIMDGGSTLEHARAIKTPEEIKAMRCAVATCEIAVEEMKKALEPGIAEVELWSILHKENIARGGEWIETRILSSGQRTNPWMQEAGPRRVADGDLLAFDTDLIGPYGFCCDISRTWYCGDGLPTREQCDLHAVALAHIKENEKLLRPGTPFHALTNGGHKLPDKYVQQRYGVKMHGVGLCDEFPSIRYEQDFDPDAFDYIVEPGMCFCVEVYVGEVGGKEGVKLEDQVIVTEDGPVNITSCPFDEKLTAGIAR
ncbi:MAG: Xaa-Pro peptidase family protein [Pseudomonadota bacterium]